MATLQAARAKALGLPDESAFSWGLNRAIFYAAAKRGFKGGGVAQSKFTKSKSGEKEIEKEEGEFFLGDEKAYIDKKESKKGAPMFEIGEKAQSPQDFEKQIVSRFGGESNFKKAWKEAMEIVKSYDPEMLKSQHEFYEQVYKPRRDELSSKWSKL
jgi:hypothetical protein